MVDYMRRKLLKRAFEGLLMFTGAGFITNCAGSQFDPNTDFKENPQAFDIKAFDAWFKKGHRNPNSYRTGIHKLYNGYNPNHNRMFHNFVEANINGWTPGHAYSIGSGIDMIAMMPGQVARTGEYNTSRAGGLFVAVQSPKIGIGNITVEYGHLDKIHLKIGDYINRGDPIGYGYEHSDKLKVMVYEGHRYGGLKDPDNYGLNHSFCDFLSNIDLNLFKNFPVDEINTKRNRQRLIVQKITSKIHNEEVLKTIMNHIHFLGSWKSPIWSSIEEFRYLETLYTIHPKLFSGLSERDFNAAKLVFYQNQPFLLTLPMKK